MKSSIKHIANHYGFKIEYSKILKKWIITHEEACCSFYWCSDESVTDFFDTLKEYFEEVGAEKSSWNY